MSRILILALCLTAVSWAASPPAAADDSQTLVYFSESGPVVIRLHLQLGGKSYRARFDEFLDALFKEVDRDGNGELTEAEMAAAPPASAFAAGPGILGGVRTAITRPAFRGKIGRKELAAHYALVGLKPFQVSTQPRESPVIRLDAMNSGPRSAAEVNKRLFELLDTNEDGKLSRAELEAAPRVLGKLDRNEDEMIDLDELLRTASAPAAAAPVVRARPVGMPPADTGPLHVVTDGPDATLAARLLAMYAKRGEKHLDAKALGLGEGKLEAEELSRLGSRKPDMEVIVRLGERGKPAVEVLKKAERGGIVIAERGGKVTLTAGKTVLELGEPADDRNYSITIDIKGQFENQFTMADQDSNGYLDKAEAERNPLFRTTLSFMGKVPPG